MARRTKGILSTLLLLLLLAGGIAVIFHFAGIGKDDITDLVNPTFRIEYAGKVYKMNTENIFAIPESGQARFEIKNCESCTVKVFPNATPETDFTFTVDGQEKKYSEIEDLTTAFIQRNNVYGDYFIIDFNNAYDFESVCSRLYGSADLEIPENNKLPSYKLVVANSRMETIEIIMCFGVLKIELPESVVF